MTSGNREGEPLVTSVGDSLVQLAAIADLWLHHDRPILQPVDDSVVRIIAGRAVTLRMARGLAPLRLALPAAVHAVAVGGQQKSAVALATPEQALLAPHVGDLDTVASRDRYLSQLSRTASLYGGEPRVWMHDLHPDYFTTHWAREQSGVHMGVQHHHAHVAAAMLEQGWLDRRVLGVAFDGTGYGTDGSIWGGEFLLAAASQFQRVAHLRPFQLPGGAAAIREPWRVAVSLVSQVADTTQLDQLLPGRLARRAKSLLPLLGRDTLSSQTTSAGRLFDGVATLVLELDRAEFEGSPAMLLEAVADATALGTYAFAEQPESAGRPGEIDWRPMILELLADLAADVPRGTMAMRFHRGLAAAVAVTCRHYGTGPIVLSGGVFQNRVLTELLAAELSELGRPLGLPGLIPPNDGGLAAGQLAVGLSRLAKEKGEVL
jgi:hydrogenase maturation protein HypF